MTPEPRPSRLSMVRDGFRTDVAKTGRLVVGLDKIVEDPKNERKVFRNMEGLVASVKAVGLVEPITVVALENGNYQIITGHRRYRAARIAGVETVEVLIREAEEEHQHRRKSIVSNVQREDIGPVEMAEALQGLLDEDETIESQVELAEIIGKDKTWVSRMLRILTLPEHLRAKVVTSQLSIPYDPVTWIARIEDAVVQESLIDELVAGATVRDIREKINQHKGVTTTAQAPAEKVKANPKQVYHTEQKATVIVQSETKSLSMDRVVAALQEALKIARRDTT
jgi:ParB/RepB/Spo0J family partition protein